VNQLHVVKSDLPFFAPPQEAADGASVGHASVRIPDVRGEEL
jgi:hypothetical protein